MYTGNFRSGPLPAVFLALIIALVPLAAGAAEGHGGGHHDYGRPGSPDQVDRTIHVDAKGTDFSKDRIQVSSGETVRLVVTNTGSTVHEFTIGPPSVQRQHREEMEKLMGSAGHGHDGGHGDSMAKSHQHGNSVMVQPGETKELIWRFSAVHDLKFGCNVPGHYEAGMHGEFVHGH